MRTINKILLALLMLLNITYGKAQQLSQDPLYKLVFIDDFDSVALNTNKWFTEPGWWGPNGANNNTGAPWCNPQPWDIPYSKRPPEDVSNGNRTFDTTGSGFQTMISKRQIFNDSVTVFPPCPSTVCTNHNVTCDPWDTTRCTIFDSVMQFKYSTAMLKSRYSFTNGYFEIRYRLPDNYPASQYNAFGPNFWIWSASRNCSDSAAYSEIDFFEQEGQQWKMGASIHYKQWEPSWVNPNPTPSAKCKNQNILASDTVFWHATGNPPNQYAPYAPKMFGPYAGGIWHTVGCEWTPDYTDFYYDTNDTIRRYSNTLLPIRNLYNMSILIGTSMMPPDNYCIPYISGQSPTSIRYDIDYVKVYQINQVNNCPATSGSFPSFTTNNYTSKLYKNLTVGGGGTAILNSGLYHLAGQDYVLLQDGFEASGSATVIISTTKCQPRQGTTYNLTDPNSNYEQRIINDMNTARQNNNGGDE